MKKLNVKLTGTISFYGISGMMEELLKLMTHAFWTTYKWINRRSQRRSYNAEEFSKLWKKFIARPHIYHDIWGWTQTPSNA